MYRVDASNTDANNIWSFGFYYYGTAVVTGKHVPYGYGVLLCFPAAPYVVQLFIQRASDEVLYIRTGHSGDQTWKDWTQLAVAV